MRKRNKDLEAASLALFSMLLYKFSIRVTKSETLPACSVLPSAKSTAAQASCSEPQSICCETSRIVFNVSLILLLIFRKDENQQGFFLLQGYVPRMAKS